MFFSERLNLHIHTRRQIELHQRVHRLLRRLENIEQALVRADLKLLPRLFIHVRRTQHAVLILHGGQRNRPGNLRARTLGRVHNLASRLIQNAIVVSLQPYANSFFSNHNVTLLTPPGVSGRKELAAGCKPLFVLLMWSGPPCPLADSTTQPAGKSARSTRFVATSQSRQSFPRPRCARLRESRSAGPFPWPPA